MPWRFWFDYCILFAFFTAMTTITVLGCANMLHVAKRELRIIKDYGFKTWWDYL